MELKRQISFLLLCFLFLLTGCGNSVKKEVEKVVSNELDLLKNFDSTTTQGYIPYEDLFPDATDTSHLSAEMEEVFSLFFKDFDYKIMEVKVDQEAQKATASVRLTTIDSRALAKDFAAAHLKQSILENADTVSSSTNSSSLEDHYLLLGKMLKTKKYKEVETNCTIHLLQNGDDWIIQKNENLENELVGGLLTYLSDPNILTPSETVDVYMKTLKKMDTEQLNTYLNLDAVLNTDDEQEKEIATALVKQIHKCFNYEIKDATDHGYTANVNVAVTSFDSASILEKYETKLDKYLATPEAVIDGEEGRLAKSQEYLLDAIKNNKATSKTDVTIELVNYGKTWNVELNRKIGQALFGNLSSSSANIVTDKEVTSEDDQTDMEDEEYEDSSYDIDAYDESYNYE